jgi:hypothetical protein
MIVSKKKVKKVTKLAMKWNKKYPLFSSFGGQQHDRHVVCLYLLMSFPNLLIAASSQGNKPYLFLNKKFPPKLWHNLTEHYFNRVIIVDKISAVLSHQSSKTGNNCKCVEGKMHSIALRLEDAFYHEACSLEVYFDLDTVETRLHELALAIREHSNQKEIEENFEVLYSMYQFEEDELHENMLLAASLA